MDASFSSRYEILDGHNNKSNEFMSDLMCRQAFKENINFAIFLVVVMISYILTHRWVYVQEIFNKLNVEAGNEMKSIQFVCSVHNRQNRKKQEFLKCIFKA